MNNKWKMWDIVVTVSINSSSLSIQHHDHSDLNCSTLSAYLTAGIIPMLLISIFPDLIFIKISMTITPTSHGFHIIRDPTRAVTARKEISIKFSSMEKSVSEFIWAANKETLTLRIIFEPRLVLALLLILSWLQSISLCTHCIVILDFYL